MTTALLSVIVPTCNRAGLLLQALDSVKAQRYRPVEIVVVDDGSDDGTGDAVAQWASVNAGPDLALRYSYQCNQGVSVARTRGFEASSGAFIHYLDSDDTVAEHSYAVVVPKMVADAVDLAHFGMEFQRIGAVTIGPRYVPAADNQSLLDDFLGGRLKGFGVAFIRTRSLVEKVGPWDASLRIAEDRDYCLRSILASDRELKIDQTLYVARNHPGPNLSATKGSHGYWSDRLSGEAKIAGLLAREGLGETKLSAFRANLYNLGIHMHARGYPDLARGFGDVARTMQTGSLTTHERRMRGVWRMGPLVCRSWVALRGTKAALRRKLPGSAAD